MCGIAGAMGSPELVGTLLAGIAARGPDSLGQWRGVRAGLAAARLRTVGDEVADQPLSSRCGRFRLVGNAEVFNSDELGPSAAGESDLSVWLETFVRQGPPAFDLIRGPFALAVVDTVDERIWLARDEWGVRPLFVRQVGDGLAFASSEAALIALGRTDADVGGWDSLLALQFLLPGRSAWSGIEAVPAGSWSHLRMGRAGLAIKHGSLRFRGRAEDDLGAAMRQSLVLQSRQSGATGIALSGGLDSSAIAGGLTELGRRPDLAAVGYFPEGGPELDERPHARRVAEELGLPLLEVPIRGADYLAAWPRVLRELGGPIAGPGSVSQWLVARALAGEGMRIVFSGQGGDELFGGYERHRQLLGRDLGLAIDPAPGYEGLLGDSDSDPARRLLFRGAPLLDHVEPERARGMLRAAQALPEPGPDLAARLLDFELEVLLPGLLHVDDATLASFGMEGRVPFLDPVVAELARREPLASKSPPDAPRARFREIFGTLLPRAAARRRDKMGFPVPLAQWLAGPLQAVSQDPSIAGTLLELGLRPSAIEALRAGQFAPRLAWFLLSCGLAKQTLQAISGEDRGRHAS